MSYKYSFRNDYSEGAHPRILSALQQSNDSQEAGYGEDRFSLEAAELIKQQIQQPSAQVHFVSGGTQANLIVLASLLKPYEAVIAAETGHIYVHEAGAIEATGHKIVTAPSSNGKLLPEQITSIFQAHQDEHMVQPKVVFISNSTEVGTVYSASEVESIAQVCKQHQLYLYLDGARLGAALTASGNDLTLTRLAQLVDVFYIGGTKNGALLGEAIVINNPDLHHNFRIHLKQRGALLAKGRVIGIQFQELFRDDLYFQLAQHANTMAGQLSEGISQLGYQFLTPSPTNQIFPIFPITIISELEKSYQFYVWASVNGETSAIRLVTSWATPQSALDQFLADLKQLG